MKFFFDKLRYLHARYEALREELAQRGMPQKSMWPIGFDFGALWNDYDPPPEAIALNRRRIAEMMPSKARYAGERL